MRPIYRTTLLFLLIAAFSPTASAQYYRYNGYNGPEGYQASQYRPYRSYYRGGDAYFYGAYDNYGAYRGNLIQRLDTQGRAGHAR